MNSQAESSQSAHSTPSHSSVDLPQAQKVSEGGCWTCRLRRKKCDEQREGDTCQTCKRLTIKCLGWGTGRPEWMRDKRAVDEYKAGIREQLSRAGLIRGQPRQPDSFGRNGPSRPVAATTRPSMSHRALAPEAPPSTSPSLGPLSNSSQMTFFPGPIFDPSELHYSPEMPSTSSFVVGGTFNYGHGVSTNSYRDMGIMSINGIYPLGAHQPLHNSALGTFDNLPDFTALPYDDDSELPASHFHPPDQRVLNIDQILIEFNNARKMLFRFDAYGAVSDITYNVSDLPRTQELSSLIKNLILQLIKQDPTGPVTKAARALGQLHQKKMRVSQGIEADTKPEHSQAVYFHNEALMQLKDNKNLQRRLSESDAVAALYLVLFSQLAGGIIDWDGPFAILCDWLVQTGLPGTEEPWLFFQGMSAAGRLAVKGALWVDIFASVTTGRAPKFFSLWRRLLGERGMYWDQNGMPFQWGLRMDTLIGCPDEALLMIAEVSVLAQWKATGQREGTLSYRELIRRGDVIEQRLLQNVTDIRRINDINLNLISNEIVGEPDVGFPSDDARALVADLFRDGSYLYLDAILSGSSVDVPDIEKYVQTTIRFLADSPSEIKRGMVLLIMLGGRMMMNTTLSRGLHPRGTTVDTGERAPAGRLTFYGKHVASQQYPLATPFIRWLMSTSISSESLCGEVVMFLLFVYLFRLTIPTTRSTLRDTDFQSRISEVERTLQSRRSMMTTDDAMAALHLVSTILFDGGRGNWQGPLKIAVLYVKSRMTGLGGNTVGIQALQKLSQEDAFVVRITIWFDVIASVTTREESLLLEMIRALFGPEVQGPSAADTIYDSWEDDETTEEEKTSMLSPMGCENIVVWALAEISALSVQKSNSKEDQLPGQQIAHRSAEIEKELKGYHSVKTLADFDNDPLVYSRYLTSHIFRTSALLYLHAVVLGASSTSPQIGLAVDEVMCWIHRIPKQAQTAQDRKIHDTVIRSTVFPFYVTGALTEDQGYRKVLSAYLSGREEIVGNCKNTETLLGKIWSRRSDEEPVSWREMLSQDGSPILLA
ncbi:hypothetical protein P691DRAFT_756900 [Macrolepiota fuliginosa MF-IS2]|uniref:Zn(2)-C6 fungal-type domain-containing protein n=1 Tax=Macrolepiota fuliginosa MF-IS2 TaxID=1400762 RepID=A0A9P5XML0_9AGAR|nr:hypothetical protein P691DRAFT_756900 [Macrolepiota fuliginosa MF-IS2]